MENSCAVVNALLFLLLVSVGKRVGRAGVLARFSRIVYKSKSTFFRVLIVRLLHFQLLENCAPCMETLGWLVDRPRTKGE